MIVTYVDGTGPDALHHGRLMKDASSTDVTVHRGVALTSFYQCGDRLSPNAFRAERTRRGHRGHGCDAGG